MAKKSNRELEEIVAQLRADVFKLSAIVYMNRRAISVLEYVRSSTSFLYSPASSDLVTRFGTTIGSYRNDRAADVIPPTVEAMYQHKLIDHSLNASG